MARLRWVGWWMRMGRRVRLTCGGEKLGRSRRVGDGRRDELAQWLCISSRIVGSAFLTRKADVDRR